LRLLRSIQPKAILIALLCFFVIYIAYAFLTNFLIREILHVKTPPLWLKVGSPLIWLVCGFISAVKARCSGTFHGAIVGLFSIVVVTVVEVVVRGGRALSQISSDIGPFILTIILAALGGLAWDIFSRLKGSNKPLKRDAAKDRRTS